jgi:hypothetical protein
LSAASQASDDTIQTGHPRLDLDLTYATKHLSQSVRLPRERLVFCAARLKQCPGQMVAYGQTLFVKRHARADELAQPLRESFAACAVYCCRNHDNASLARSLISKKYHELLSLPLVESIDLELAQTQAILLLHIIHLFDGNDALRAEGECHLDWLRGRILRLQRRAEMQEIDGISYSAWVLIESIRRTILAATFIESIYLSLREGICTTLPFMSLLPITVSGRLWETKSEDEWHELRELVNAKATSYLEAVELWSDPMRRDPLEDLQQVLFAACRGTSSLRGDVQPVISQAACDPPREFTGAGLE